MNHLDPERLRLAAAWLVALVLLYAVFEFGRAIAGHSAITAYSQRRALAERVEQLTRAAQDLERRAAAGEVGQRIDAQAQADAQAMMGELQAELGRQQQELDFYRGLVAERFGSGNLKVQELSVREEGPRRFVVSVTLVQTTLRDQLATGTLTIALDGSRRGALTRLSMREVSADSRSQVSFSLRYFQTLQVPLLLPEDFEPAALRLEYRSSRTGPDAQQQTFPWPAVLEPAQAGALTPATG